MKSKRLKKCRAPDCDRLFAPRNSLEKVCSPQCALDLVRLEQKRKQAEIAKLERRELRRRREALKTKGDWMREAQEACNRYIRLRDRDDPCISCGRYEWEIKHSSRGGKWDAGHYISRGAAPELRFHEDNIHKQCKYCNDRLSGNFAQYRIRLIEKIGLERVEFLEGPHELPRWRIEDFKVIKANFNKKHRELKKILEKVA